MNMMVRSFIYPYQLAAYIIAAFGKLLVKKNCVTTVSADIVSSRGRCKTHKQELHVGFC